MKEGIVPSFNKALCLTISCYLAPLNQVKYLFVKAVFSKLVWWVTPQFSPNRQGYYR